MLAHIMEPSTHRSVCSWVVFMFYQLKFFSKPGMLAWSLIGVGMQVFDVIGFFKHTLDPIFVVLMAVWGFQLLFTPPFIYHLAKHTPDLLQDKHLEFPVFKGCLALPLSLFLVLDIISFITIQQTDSAYDLAITVLRKILQLFTHLIFLQLSIFFLAVTVSSFIHKCELFYKAPPCHGVYEEAQRLLANYRSLKKGCRFGLFVIFVALTLLIIANGFMLVMVSKNCMKVEDTRIFAFVFVVDIMIVTYFGLLMDEGYQQFQNITDTLR